MADMILLGLAVICTAYFMIIVFYAGMGTSFFICCCPHKHQDAKHCHNNYTGNTCSNNAYRHPPGDAVHIFPVIPFSIYKKYA